MNRRGTPVWLALVLSAMATMVFALPGIALVASGELILAPVGLLIVVVCGTCLGLPIFLILRSSVFTGPAWYVCRHCGYDLRGTGGMRCPECGRMHVQHVA